MQFKVVTVRNQGRRLTRVEIEAAVPLVGDVVVRDLAAEGNSWNRAMRCAELIDESSPQSKRTMLPPLFDPVLVQVTPASVLLMGCELEVVDGVIHEHVQGWLLRVTGTP